MELRTTAMESGGDRTPSRPLWLGQVSREVEGLARRASVGLVAGGRAEGLVVLRELGRVFGVAPVSVTEAMLSGDPVCRWDDLAERVAGCPMVFDLEALCWDREPALDLLRFLRLHARKHGTVALWPGRIAERVATFSALGRRDYVRVALTDIAVLRPVPTRFPDEVPFKIERIP